MKSWKRSAIKILSRIEEPIDALKLRFKRDTGQLEPLMIYAYRGHSTERCLFLKGRVLEYTGVSRASSIDTPWRNLINMYRRFTSNEIPDARVRATLGEHTWETTTDREGYFSFEMELPETITIGRTWKSIKLELLEPKMPQYPPVRAIGHVLVPQSNATFAIISDIDDTVVKTSATSLIRMARIVLLANAHSRVPFEGVAAFYRALQRGGSGYEKNPIFYVSSGPWNLYDLLVHFLNVHRIPVGPLFLRDFGFDVELLSSEGHHNHKLDQIKRLIAAYPRLQFVLIGDSGQEDPEIYRQVVHDFPGRVKAIYIRDVTSQQRHDEVKRIANEVAQHGVEMVLAGDTWEAAKHAVDRQLICPNALPVIRAKKKEDEQVPEAVI